MTRSEAGDPLRAAGRSAKRLRLLVGVPLLCAVVSAVQAPSPSRLFQDAIHLMETKGDYPAALRLFEQIAKGSDRNLAARSLLYAGLCYEKLGKREARNAYERLIRDFADQADLITAARARLAALTPAGGSPASRGMAAHRVLAEFPSFAALSHDGQRLSFPDWDTGNLALMDLESKQKRSLTRKGTWEDSGEHAYSSAHSPDGKQIAYVWWNGQDILELRVLGLNGTGPRVLYRNADLWHLEVADWSPDGRYILCTFVLKTGRNQIALVSVGNGDAQVLKTFDWRGPAHLSLSPDGRYVAYDLPQRDGSLDRDVFLLAVRGTREAVLVDHPANEAFKPRCRTCTSPSSIQKRARLRPHPRRPAGGSSGRTAGPSGLGTESSWPSCRTDRRVGRTCRRFPSGRSRRASRRSCTRG